MRSTVGRHRLALQLHQPCHVYKGFAALEIVKYIKQKATIYMYLDITTEFDQEQGKDDLFT